VRVSVFPFDLISEAGSIWCALWWRAGRVVALVPAHVPVSVSDVYENIEQLIIGRTLPSGSRPSRCRAAAAPVTPLWPGRRPEWAERKIIFRLASTSRVAAVPGGEHSARRRRQHQRRHDVLAR
jgi:hypothetical protein